jgi:nucleoid DNA-binding protein
MNNSDLADKIAAAHGLTKADSRKIVDAVFAAIVDASAQGEEVAISGSESSRSRTRRLAKAAIPPPARPCRLRHPGS